MGTPFLGEVKLVSFQFAPKGWAFCNGQLLPINQNQALFALLGTNFGGNGQTTFGLPDLRGRAALHMGAGFVLGQMGGETAHTVTLGEMPAHTHMVQASSNDGDTQAPANNFFARTVNNIYGKVQDVVTLSPATVTNFGGSQPHNNMQPYTGINFVIALIGVFPSRN